jgi:hypothetical protein
VPQPTALTQLIWQRYVSNRLPRSRHYSMLTTTHQAFQELAKGEQTAAALESQLTAMEARIEAMLAEAEKNEAIVKAAQENGDNKPEGSS